MSYLRWDGAVYCAEPLCSALFFFQYMAHNYTVILGRYSYTCLFKSASTIRYGPAFEFPPAAAAAGAGIVIERVQQL